MKTVSIYGLFDPRNDELRYIGKTKYALSIRLSQHIHEAKKYRKTHRHKWINSLLKKKVKPYIDVLEETTELEWEEAEKKWIAESREQGINLVNETNGGEGPIGRKLSEDHIEAIRQANLGNTHTLGRKHSDETKQKLREAHKKRKVYPKGWKHTEETKRKLALASTGKKLSVTTRKKISESKVGRPRSEKTKQKLREVNLGKKLTKETRHKMSESRRNISKETRKKLSNASKGNQRAKGMIHSEETRRKISEASKRMWEKRRNEN